MSEELEEGSVLHIQRPEESLRNEAEAEVVYLQLVHL